MGLEQSVIPSPPPFSSLSSSSLLSTASSKWPDGEISENKCLQLMESPVVGPTDSTPCSSSRSSNIRRNVFLRQFGDFLKEIETSHASKHSADLLCTLSVPSSFFCCYSDNQFPYEEFVTDEDARQWTDKREEECRDCTFLRLPAVLPMPPFPCSYRISRILVNHSPTLEMCHCLFFEKQNVLHSPSVTAEENNVGSMVTRLIAKIWEEFNLKDYWLDDTICKESMTNAALLYLFFGILPPKFLPSQGGAFDAMCGHFAMGMLTDELRHDLRHRAGGKDEKEQRGKVEETKGDRREHCVIGFGLPPLNVTLHKTLGTLKKEAREEGVVEEYDYFYDEKSGLVDAAGILIQLKEDFPLAIEESHGTSINNSLSSSPQPLTLCEQFSPLSLFLIPNQKISLNEELYSSRNVYERHDESAVMQQKFDQNSYLHHHPKNSHRAQTYNPLPTEEPSSTPPHCSPDDDCHHYQQGGKYLSSSSYHIFSTLGPGSSNPLFFVGETWSFRASCASRLSSGGGGEGPFINPLLRGDQKIAKMPFEDKRLHMRMEVLRKFSKTGCITIDQTQHEFISMMVLWEIPDELHNSTKCRPHLQVKAHGPIVRHWVVISPVFHYTSTLESTAAAVVGSGDPPYFWFRCSHGPYHKNRFPDRRSSMALVMSYTQLWKLLDFSRGDVQNPIFVVTKKINSPREIAAKIEKGG